MLSLRNSSLTVLLLICVGCSHPTSLPTVTVDGAKALERVQAIVDIGPRPSNSANAKKTAEFLKASCAEFVDDVTLDTWTEDTATGKLTFHNVYAILPGKGKTVVLGSHFDTKDIPGIPDFRGANDSASSTGLILEILSTLSSTDAWHGPTIIFAFFDGEECLEKYRENDGLHGSKRMITWLEKKGTLKNVDAMILLDMIGDTDLTLTISPEDNANLRKLLTSAADELGYSKHVGSSKGGITDDHVPFKKRGIPAIDLIDFKYGPKNAYWHTDEDTMDKISADSLKVVGELTIRLLQKISWQP
jgi:glutaminyl-peptide cyclotransferase